MASVMWTLIKDSPNYLSACGNYIAIYRHSYGGLATYWTFPITEKKRMQKNAISVGGLPDKGIWNNYTIVRFK